MRRGILLVMWALMLLAACQAGQPSLPPLTTIRPAGSPQQGCGDGVCNGPESVDNCPQDCQRATPLPSGLPPSPASTASDTPALRFFYAIHTHAAGDHLPYSEPARLTIDPRVADNLLAAIEDIAEVLDRYGAKGTWEVVDSTATGLCTYQGPEHIFRQLQSRGHEIGVHAHQASRVDDTVAALHDDCGITARTTSGFMTYLSGESSVAQEEMSRAIELSLELGLNVGTSNLSPSGNRNPFGDLCGNQLGIGNNMWAQSGNLMFPWRPDHARQDICADSPDSAFVMIDHASIEWIILPGQGVPDILGDEHFAQLRRQFDQALAYMEAQRPSRVAAWGFVTHVTEYAEGNIAENPPDPAALAALDRFFAYVDAQRAEGRVIYATAAEIADLAFPDR